jgi:YHS domain-containing protein
MRTFTTSLLGGTLVVLATGLAWAEKPTQAQLQAAAKATGTVNGLCPVTRKLVAPAAGTANYKGEKIGFARATASGEFSADPTRYMDRMRLNPPKFWYVTRTPPVVAMRKAKEACNASNGRCPVMGKVVVVKGGFATHRGQRIQFCCPPCKAKFEKDPQKYMRWMRADPLAYAYDRPGPTNAEMRIARTTHGTANGRCPVMGNLVVAKGGAAIYQGQSIGFCCPRCSAKFNKDPEQYMRRLRAEPGAYGYVKPRR